MPGQRLKIDLERITLGQWMDIELASGRPYTDFLRSKTGLTMVALYLRACEQLAPGMKPPSWSELEGMSPSEASQFASREPADSGSKISDN